jgi:hypothetical protein
MLDLNVGADNVRGISKIPLYLIYKIAVEYVRNFWAF